MSDGAQYAENRFFDDTDSEQGLKGASLILSEPYIDEVHFTGNDEKIKEIKEIVLKDCAVLDINVSSTDWEELSIDWDMDQRVLRTTINGIHDQELAIAGDAGGFSNMTVCLEGGEGEVRRLAIAQVMAESHRPGLSGFDFSELAK